MIADDEENRPIRRPARFQISENTLFNAGMDRPTVEALRHLLDAVGNTPGPTLPEAVTEIGVLGADILALSIAPGAQPPTPVDDDLRPAVQMAEQIEFLQTEVRQLAEQVATLTNQINDLKQGLTT